MSAAVSLNIRSAHESYRENGYLAYGKFIPHVCVCFGIHSFHLLCSTCKPIVSLPPSKPELVQDFVCNPLRLKCFETSTNRVRHTPRLHSRRAARKQRSKAFYWKLKLFSDIYLQVASKISHISVPAICASTAGSQNASRLLSWRVG